MWPRGRPIVRVFAAAHPPTSFNPTGSPARFRPVHEADGAVVPTMYGGADADVALAESVMHDLSASTTRIPYARLADRAICTLLPLRDLRLAALHGYGLKKAKVTRKRLIDTPPSRYPETAAWGQAIYEHRGPGGRHRLDEPPLRLVEGGDALVDARRRRRAAARSRER